MPFNPSNGNSEGKIATPRKVLFAIACLVSFFFVFKLISFKSATNSAMSGELLTTGDSQNIVESHSFFEQLCNYFGGVTYLFPLVLIYVAYKVIIKGVNLKHVDYFLVGLFVLGFNLLVLGLCPLFSALSGTAGGDLGDKIYYSFLAHLPLGTGAVVAFGIALLGLFLFTGHGLFFFADKIGELIFNPFDKKFEKKEKPKVQEKEPSPSEKQDVFSKKEEELEAAGAKIKAHLKTSLDKKAEQEAEQNTYKASSTHFNTGKLEPFGEQTSLFSNSVEESFKDNTKTDKHEESKSHFRSSFKHNNLSERIEPGFGGVGTPDVETPSFGTQEPVKYLGPSTAGRNYESTPSYNETSAQTQSSYEGQQDSYASNSYNETQASTSVSSSEQSSGPTSYITGVSAYNQATAPAYDDYEEPKTIIKDSRVQEEQPKTVIKKTIITRFDKSQSGQSMLAPSTDGSASTVDESKSSTIIYKAGADHLEPTESVGSPMRHSEVSTLITRTQTLPNVNADQNLKVDANNGAISGEFTQDNKTSSTGSNGSYQETPSSAMVYTEDEDNIINFADFNKEQKTIKVDHLTDSFIPAEPQVIAVHKEESRPQDNENRLTFNQSAPIKESDLHSEQYSRGTRGVNGSVINQNAQNLLGSEPQSNVNKTTSEKEESPVIIVPPYNPSNNNSSNNNSSNNQSNTAQNAYNASSNEQTTQSTSAYTTANSNLAEGGFTTSAASQNPNAYNAPFTHNEQTSSTNSAYGSNSSSSVGSVSTASPFASTQTSTANSTITTTQAPQDNYSQNPPFENMSTINGTIPNRPMGTAVPMRGRDGSKATVAYARATETSPRREYNEWRPELSLLAHSEKQEDSFEDEQEFIDKTEVINKFMKDFGVRAQVERYVKGPVITRFDLSLEPGVKSSTISSLNADLTRILGTNKIKILLAVPGTPYLGIEVPNNKRKMITVGDVVETDEFLSSKASLPMCMGVDTVGHAVVADLAKAPHLLIAGTTGSGKSAGLNSMLVSLLLARSPAELRLIMVDPKQVEFAHYVGLPHLLTPIINDPESTLAALGWLVKEQERRYKVISALHLSNILQVNQMIKSENAQGRKVYDPMWSPEMGGSAPELKIIPYIVLVIDEFADLVVASGGKKGDKNLDTLIARLAAKARAAGIHLILATQTPRAEIVTGPIRANMPSRVGYTVQNGTDSRIILDEPGAEKLLGMGDMLIKFQSLRNSQCFRAHGPFASNDDVDAVVGAWINNAGEPEYVEGVTDDEDEEEVMEEDMGSDGVKYDEKFDAVVDYIRTACQGRKSPISVSSIQTNFSLGYPRAKRLHNSLIQAGILDSKGFIVTEPY